MITKGIRNILLKYLNQLIYVQNNVIEKKYRINKNFKFRNT